MTDYLDCDVSQYADDTLSFTSSKDLANAKYLLTSNCSEIIKYFNMHTLQANLTKTEYMVINPTDNDHLPDDIIILDNNPILASKITKHLGVVIDNNLLFDKQVTKVAQK